MFTPSTETLREHKPLPKHKVRISSWIWELLSFLVSMLCVTGILVILAHYDQKPAPNLGWLTLNGIIGTLAAVAKAALILPLSESISQLKWLWFWNDKQPKPVTDFQFYDSASRGPWGSLCLLVRPRLLQLVSLGALLTVLALAMETFLQLIPAYDSRLSPHPGRTGKIGLMKFFKDIAIDQTSWQTARVAPFGYKGAFFSALFGSSTGTWDMQPSCPTGNCTWAPYSSLAVCHSCTNITEMVQRTPVDQEPNIMNDYKPSAQFSLGNGAKVFSGDSQALTQFTGANIWTGTVIDPSYRNWSIAYTETQNMSIINGMPLYWAPGKYDKYNITPHAYECILYFCVNTYSAMTTSGKLTETLLSSWPDPREPMPLSLSSQQSVEALYDISRPTDIANIHYANASIIYKAPDANGTEHILDWLTLDSVRSWTQQVWALPDTGGSMSNLDATQVTFSMYTSGTRNALKAANLTVAEARQRMATMPGPDQLWSDVARSLTTYLRSTGTDVAIGEALSVQTFVSARWGWAIMPMSLLGIGLFFMMMTFIITVKKNVPIWKSNSLPPLLLGLDTETSQAMIGFTRSADAMEKQGRLYSMAMSHEAGFPRMRAESKATKSASRFSDA